jgi:hypothetical protein
MTLSALGILSAAGAGRLRVAVAGYFGGGFETAAVATVDRFAFPSDTRSTLGTGLSSSREQNAGMANSGVAGYFCGGIVGASQVSTIDKFSFPSDTRTSVSGLTTRANSGGFANSGVAGYIGGGESVSGSRLNSVNKITFPADTITTLGTNLSTATGYITGCANNGVAGYFVGGEDSVDSGTRRGHKYTFPSDTYSSNNSFLPTNQGTMRAAGFANSGVAGYIAGGQRASVYTTVHKIAFPSDTVTQLGTGLSTARFYLGGMANSGSAGYVAGGQTATNVSTRVSTVDVFAFPSDTRSTLGTGLSAIRTRIAGMADAGVF